MSLEEAHHHRRPWIRAWRKCLCLCLREREKKENEEKVFVCVSERERVDSLLNRESV